MKARYVLKYLLHIYLPFYAERHSCVRLDLNIPPFIIRFCTSLQSILGNTKKNLEAARMEGGMRWVVISAFSCRFSPRKLYIIFCCAYNAPKEMNKLYNQCKLIVWIIMHSQTRINALFVACCPSQMPKFLKINPAFNQRMNQTKFWC